MSKLILNSIPSDGIDVKVLREGLRKFPEDRGITLQILSKFKQIMKEELL